MMIVENVPSSKSKISNCLGIPVSSAVVVVVVVITTVIAVGVVTTTTTATMAATTIFLITLPVIIINSTGRVPHTTLLASCFPISSALFHSFQAAFELFILVCSISIIIRGRWGAIAIAAAAMMMMAAAVVVVIRTATMALTTTAVLANHFTPMLTTPMIVTLAETLAIGQFSTPLRNFLKIGIQCLGFLIQCGNLVIEGINLVP